MLLYFVVFFDKLIYFYYLFFNKIIERIVGWWWCFFCNNHYPVLLNKIHQTLVFFIITFTKYKNIKLHRWILGVTYYSYKPQHTKSLCHTAEYNSIILCLSVVSLTDWPIQHPYHELPNSNIIYSLRADTNVVLIRERERRYGTNFGFRISE